MITLYGLKNCDTCRAAMKALEGAGRAYRLVDIRAEADVRTLAPRWIEAAGVEALVNKRSTTWRSLSEAERGAASSAAGAAALLAAHPTLVKRPVIEHDGAVLVGWTSDTQRALGL